VGIEERVIDCAAAMLLIGDQVVFAIKFEDPYLFNIAMRHSCAVIIYHRLP